MGNKVSNTKTDSNIMQKIEEEIAAEVAKKKELNKKKRITISVICAVIVIAIATSLIVTLVVNPTIDYNEGKDLLEKGKNAEAYAKFAELGRFKDSDDICDKLLQQFPHFAILTAKTGEVITFGKYEQDNNISNGTEDIQWIVLKNENGVLYAVSKHILDAQVFNTHNGDGSTLKGWLKDDFCDRAFETIPNGFVSKVGLLKREDIDAFKDVVNVKPEWTAYAKAQNPENYGYAGYTWWLDEDYFHGVGSSDVDMAVVYESGMYEHTGAAVTDINGVRPMIIVDYVSADIDYYIDDYDDIDNAGVTTRFESPSGGNAGSNNNSDKNNGTTKKSKCAWCGGDGRTHDWVDSGQRCYKCGGSGWLEYED